MFYPPTAMGLQKMDCIVDLGRFMEKTHDGDGVFESALGSAEVCEPEGEEVQFPPTCGQSPHRHPGRLLTPIPETTTLDWKARSSPASDVVHGTRHARPSSVRSNCEYVSLPALDAAVSDVASPRKKQSTAPRHGQRYLPKVVTGGEPTGHRPPRESLPSKRSPLCRRQILVAVPEPVLEARRKSEPSATTHEPVLEARRHSEPSVNTI